jgi:protoporphyrinogen oxidase
MTHSVGIVGGGLLGLGIAYELASKGVQVDVYEADKRLGGLAGSTRIGGVAVDRYYHCVTTTDHKVVSLAEELGLSIRWRPLGVGFYHDGQRCSMSTPVDVLRFPGLRIDDKARLAAFVLACGRISDHEALDEIGIEEWARAKSGNRLWERLWAPLLDSKFDGRYDDLPATYLWSRMRRTAGTRSKGGREVMGAIEGGYQALVDRLAERIQGMGSRVHTSTPIRHIPASATGRALGVVTEEGLREHDTVVTTQLRPNLSGLLDHELERRLGGDPLRYMGIVCLVARVKKSVSPYYAINITDRRVPITSVVETTHVVDPEAVEGHLIYVPKYVQSTSADLTRSSEDITDEFLGHVQTLFGDFRREDVIASQVARARVAEPVHVAGVENRIPPVFAAPGLAVASSARVHPNIVHGQAIAGVAEHVAGEVLARLSTDIAQQRSAA